MRLSFVLLLPLAFVPTTVYGRGDSPQQKAPVDKGIFVGQPKIFDQRTLLQLQKELQRALAGSMKIDVNALTAALGKVQGNRSNSSQNLLGVNFANPTTTIEDKKTTTTPGSGESKDPSTVQTRTETRDTKPPSTFDLTKLTNDLSQTAEEIIKASSLSLSPASLLSEQLQLNAQLMNLKLLLERSVTDRVIGAEPRLQTVVGFTINVNSQYKFAIAEATIELTPTDANLEPISVVSLLPKEKTYNVGQLSQKSTGFGLGALVQPFNLGLQSNQSSQSLFLVQDFDTVALERQPENPDKKNRSKSIQFSWQFRPVLDHQTVDPGSRQVFAMLALPKKSSEPMTFKATCRTVWRSYDKKRNIVGKEIPGTESCQCLGNITVDPIAEQEKHLSPRIREVVASDAGEGNMNITVSGENFFTDTLVTAGGLPITNTNHDSEQHIRFTLPAKQLLTSDVVLVTPYGNTIPITIKETNTVISLNYSSIFDDNDGDDNLFIKQISAQKSRVTLIVNNKNTESSDKRYYRMSVAGSKKYQIKPGQADLKNNEDKTDQKVISPILILAGGDVFGLSNNPYFFDEKKLCDGTTLQKYIFDVDTSKIVDSGRIIIRNPLTLDISAVLYMDDKYALVSEVIKLSSNEKETVLGFRGRGLGSLRVFSGKKELMPQGIGDNRFVTFIVDTNQLRESQSLTVQPGIGKPVFAISLVEAQKPVPVAIKPAVEKIDPAIVRKAIPLKVSGQGLDQIAAVKVNGKPLSFGKFGGEDYFVVPTLELVEDAVSFTVEFYLRDTDTKPAFVFTVEVKPATGG